MQTSFILKENEYRPSGSYNILGHPALLKVGSADTFGQLSLFTGEYRKNQSPPLHTHDFDETLYILEGEFIIQAAENRFNAITGDTIFIPRNLPHTYLTISETGKMLFMANPSGTLEQFFQKVSQFKGEPTNEELTEVQQSTGVMFVGPPIAP